MTDKDQNEVVCWSKKLPTEAGYYWVRKKEFIHFDDEGPWTLRVFHVFIGLIDAKNKLAVEEHGDDGWYNLDEYGDEFEWLGPLIEPPIDAEAG